MATIGRKNVHGKGGVRFKTGYTASKYKSMLRTAVTDLIVHEEITVTQTVARDLSALADKMITLGKRGDLHARRLAAATDCPTPRLFSSGICNAIFLASSGYSFSSTSFARFKMIAPPSPLVTRPIIITCLIS